MNESSRGEAIDELLTELGNLRDADRRKDDLLAMLAHELRNPLATICSDIELLKMPTQQQQVQAAVVQRLDRQARQLVRLVDDIVDVSRISRGKLGLDTAPTDLREIVRNAVIAAQPLVERSGHELTVTAPAEPVLADVDAARIEQVLSNLVSNATKYTPKGGSIRIELRHHGADAVIDVEDTGVGIPPDEQQRVFEKFARLYGEEHEPGGQGIELTLSKSLVEMHGGSLSVSSAGDGHGGRFGIRLPVQADPAGPTSASASR